MVTDGLKTECKDLQIWIWWQQQITRKLEQEQEKAGEVNGANWKQMEHVIHSVTRFGIGVA